jgi:hypothetical protein
MIKVNLLPADSGKRASASRRPSGPSPAPFYLLLFLLYIGALGAGYYVYSAGAESAEKVRQSTKARDDLKAEVQRRQAEFEANNLRSQEIEEKYAVVAALGPENRIFWSEKLNMIAMARLNLAVYITKIELQEQIDERETPESVLRREEWKKEKEKNPKLTTPEPQPVKQPIINQTLIINGISYGTSSEQQLRQITQFSQALKNLSWTRESGEETSFTERLVSQFAQPTQKADVVAGVDVMRFDLRIKADPQLDRTMDLDDSEVINPNEENAEGQSNIAAKRALEAEVINQ